MKYRFRDLTQVLNIAKVWNSTVTRPRERHPSGLLLAYRGVWGGADASLVVPAAPVVAWQQDCHHVYRLVPGMTLNNKNYDVSI